MSTDKGFKKKVYKLVNKIPKGKVATYGQIAGMLGNPFLARNVGFALRTLEVQEDIIPWWRVLNGKGYLSINQGNLGSEKMIQKQSLERDGVKVSDDFEVDLEKYLWQLLP